MRQTGTRERWAARGSSLALTGGSLAIAIIALAALFLEARPYFVSGLSTTSRIEALTERGHTSGLSFASQQLVLDDCYAAVNSLEARAAPQAQWMQLLARCGEVTSDVLDAAPTHGYGWLVAALVSARTADMEAFKAQLARSQAVAPNEGWLATERIKLAEQWRDGAALSEDERRDLEVFLDAGRLDPAIRQLYARDAGFRTRLNSVLETRSAAVQRRFVNGIRAALSGEGA